MTKDLNFNKIIDKLKELNKNNPDLKFGNILQSAIDKKKGKENYNLCDMNSKEILNSLEEYDISIKNRKKYKGNKNDNNK